MPRTKNVFFRSPVQRDVGLEKLSGYDEIEQYLDRTLQEPYMCPITHKIFKNPVKFNACAHTVEEEVAMEALKSTKTCPCCDACVEEYKPCGETKQKVDLFLYNFPGRVQSQYQLGDVKEAIKSRLSDRAGEGCTCVLM